MTISGPRSGYTKTPGHESTKRVVENIPLKDASKKILHALIQGPYTFSTKSMDQLFNRTKNGNKEISRNVFEKIRSGSFPIDIIFDVTRQDIDVIFYDREGGHMKIESEELFKEFCLIHRIFPWIRKIYINNGSSHDLDNLPTNEHHYSITHKLLSAGENGAYISLKTYSNLYNVKIGALIDYVESIQHLREKQISIFSQKLINRNVYEMMILEVIYKYLNEYSEKGRYHIHPQLSTFIEDHEDKIDNVVEITSSDSGSMHEPYKIGIQLTAKSNFDEKFNKIVPLIKNDIIFLDLAE